MTRDPRPASRGPRAHPPAALPGAPARDVPLALPPEPPAAQGAERPSDLPAALPSAAPAAAHPHATFDAGWLALRAVADARARAAQLTRLAADWLLQRHRAGRALRLLDLGSGSGANPRFLAPRLPGPQHWVLVDHDPALLARACSGCRGLRDGDGRPVRVTPHRCDLRKLGGEGFAGADLVCASALLDLVDARWLATFAAACAAARCAALVTLSVDGGWRFDAAAGTDPDDAFVRAAFNAHQRSDKGLGPALGADAALRLADGLGRRGHAVTLASSPWQLDLAAPADATLAAALIDGWRDAASAQNPAAGRCIAAWHARRCALLGQPGARLTVGHLDLFARPTTHGGAAG